MSDLISRQDAVDAMHRLEAEDIDRYGCSIPEGFHSAEAVEALQALPSAEPERKNGKWIERSWCNEQCSVCGAYFPVSEFKTRPFEINFCPNCGADMRGEN